MQHIYPALHPPGESQNCCRNLFVLINFCLLEFAKTPKSHPTLISLESTAPTWFCRILFSCIGKGFLAQRTHLSVQVPFYWRHANLPHHLNKRPLVLYAGEASSHGPPLIIGPTPLGYSLEAMTLKLPGVPGLPLYIFYHLELF